MSKTLLEARSQPSSRIIDSIADGTRRETLSVLDGRAEPVSPRYLATAVTAAVTDTSPADVSAGDREQIHVGLVHNHLPKLDAAGLVTYDADAVATTDNPVLEDPRFRRLVAGESDGWDRVLAAIAPRRRRVVLAVLEGTDGLERAEVARHVVAHENDVAPSAVPRSETEDAAETLHHAHFPALRQAGLIDCEDGRVRYDGHPDLESEWWPLELTTPELTNGR